MDVGVGIDVGVRTVASVVIVDAPSPLSSREERKRHDAMEKRTVSRGILRWEYQDLVIPLTISVLHWRTPDYVGAATPRIQPMIAAALATAAREGWQADEPTDFPTLFSRSRVRTTNTFIRWRVTSVTIHQMRPIRREGLVPHG